METKKQSLTVDNQNLLLSNLSHLDIQRCISPVNTKKLPERNIPSPYENALLNRRYKKIYPNRVYTPWYRRYVNKLPPIESLDFQPFDEVQKVDEDIAIQYFYGEDANLVDASFDRNASDKRKSALQRYRRVKEQEEKQRATAEAAEMTKMGAGTRFLRFHDSAKQPHADMETEFGATIVEKKVYTPIVEFLQKLHIGKQRQLRKVIIKPTSKWNMLKNPVVMHKLRMMYARIKQDEIHARFRKVIKLVVAVIRFIETIRLISGDTKKILREIQQFMDDQTQDSQKPSLFTRKHVFDPRKYNITKELHISFETKLTLTKPWFTRRDDEIDKVIEALQSYKSFVQYPPMFQRRLATLAWYIETQADKYIIRERHIACDFYVLLTGKAKVVKMEGNPYIYGGGHLNFIRYIKKSEGFGDESMSDPECEREYSVISSEPCALLSISVHDYLQMLSTRKEDEFAPEHIIFLCNLKLLDKFPKAKLLQEGNENITIHYFRPETVISKDLEESNFVFVVSSGSCQLLAEIFPEVRLPQKKEPTLIRKSIKKVKKPIHRFKPSFARILGMKGKMKTTMPSINWMKQQIDSQKMKMEQMFYMTGLSTKDYYDKTQQILNTLPKHQRTFMYASGFPQMSSMLDPVECRSLTATTKEEFLQPLAQIMSSYFQQVKSATSISEIVDDTKQPAHESCPDVSSPDKKHSRLHVKMSMLSEHTECSSEEGSTLTDKESFVSSMTRDSLPVELPKVENVVHEGPLRKSLAPEKKFQGDAIEDVDEFVHLGSTITIKGGVDKDIQGQEWLDYRDGPYEPPEEIMSLVSKGCEMVMVKKTFLLKYLRKEW